MKATKVCGLMLSAVFAATGCLPDSGSGSLVITNVFAAQSGTDPAATSCTFGSEEIRAAGTLDLGLFAAINEAAYVVEFAVDSLLRTVDTTAADKSGRQITDPNLNRFFAEELLTSYEVPKAGDPADRLGLSNAKLATLAKPDSTPLSMVFEPDSTDNRVLGNILSAAASQEIINAIPEEVRGEPVYMTTSPLRVRFQLRGKTASGLKLTSSSGYVVINVGRLKPPTCPNGYLPGTCGGIPGQDAVVTCSAEAAANP